MKKRKVETCYDTMVIGTGIGGLTAGLRIARQGYRVLFLESAKILGGMLNPFTRRGLHFDVGIHYLAQAGPGEDLRNGLNGLGLDEVRFREINPECIDRYVFHDYEARLVKGIDRWGDVLAADFPHEERNIRRFLELLKRIDALWRSSGGGRTLLCVARLLPHGGEVLRLFRLTFNQLLSHYFEDPLLKGTIGLTGVDLGTSPGRFSALGSVILLNYFLGGAYYPVGGGGSLRDAYVRALRKYDAEFLRDRRVVRIERRSDGCFCLHTHDEECFVGKSVVSNVEVRQTLDMLGNLEPSRWARNKADTLRPGLSAFCVFLATDLDITQHGISDTNIWSFPHADLEEPYRRAYAGELADPPPFFLTSPTLKDPSRQRAPSGVHTLELITMTSGDPFRKWFPGRSMHRDGEYNQAKDAVIERLVCEVEKRYIPGLREHLLHREGSTPATVWHYVRSHDGGSFGAEHSPDQYALRRFLPTIGIPGLYLAGASVFGGGISPCFQSGRAAAAWTMKYLAKHHPARRAAAVAVTPRRLFSLKRGVHR